MNGLTTENNILDAAVNAIHRETGIQLKVVEQGIQKGNQRIDAIIEMPETGTQLFVKIKKWAAQTNLGAIINQVNNLAEAGYGLLVADYINPKMGERLKNANIQFLDTAGNAYIQQQAVYIYIKGNKPQQNVTAQQKIKTGKAFQPTGLKVLFAILQDRELINAPYREIADRAQVALGAVGCVIRDLIAQGFLLEGVEKKQRKLANVDQLLDKWIEVYPHKLKAKYKFDVFTTDNPDWWKTIDPEKFNALWGGEVAAAKYTHYLNPKQAVVYINKADKVEFLKAARLRKPKPDEVPDVQIELIEPFWTAVEDNQQTTGLAHPIITYADLVETGETRNLETANRLREKYLR